MNEQELNEKLAEWAGEEGNYTQSLDACFKWLVPKVNGLGYLVQIWSYLNGDGSVDIFQFGEKPVATATAETPALALCLAIEKLINKESK